MFHYFLMETPQGKKALDYVTKRGLTKETIQKFKLGYAPADHKGLKKFLLEKNFSADFLNKSGLFSQKYPDYSFFSDRLMFPIFNRKGQVVAFGGRVPPLTSCALLSAPYVIRPSFSISSRNALQAGSI